MNRHLTQKYSAQRNPNFTSHSLSYMQLFISTFTASNIISSKPDYSQQLSATFNIQFLQWKWEVSDICGTGVTEPVQQVSVSAEVWIGEYSSQEDLFCLLDVYPTLYPENSGQCLCSYPIFF